MKKLYVVSIETEIVVIAEDEAEAEMAARDAALDVESDFAAREMTYLPSGWESDSIPYGDGDDEDQDRTIEGWVNAGAAEAYKTHRDRKAARVQGEGPAG